MPKARATPTDLWDPYWAKDGRDEDELLLSPDPATDEDQSSGGLQTGSAQPVAALDPSLDPTPQAAPNPSSSGARPFSATYIPNTYNGKPTVGANMGGNGLSSGARFLEQYVETPFDQKGFRQTGSATEYNPSKDQMARSVVDGVVVPRQVGAPIQIDPKYGGGVGTVINPFSSSMGSTPPAAPSFAAPPERQPISYTTATGSITTDPAKQFLSNLDGLKEWDRKNGALQTGSVQSSNGLGGGQSEANTLAQRMRSNERLEYKAAQLAARRSGMQGRVPRGAFGLGGGSDAAYLGEAQRIIADNESRKKGAAEAARREKEKQADVAAMAAKDARAEELRKKLGVTK